MNDEKLVRFVTRHLNAGTAMVDPTIRHRLRIARSIALSRQTIHAGAHFAGMPGLFHIDLVTKRALLRLAMMVVLSLGVAYWHAREYIGELEDLDSAILTDEMPMDVITDKGFDAWLKSSAAR